MQIDGLLATAEDSHDVDQFKTEQEGKYRDFEENYFLIVSKMEHLLQSSLPEATNHSNDMQSLTLETNVRDISQVHLPKINISKFNGNYQEWYPFHDTFELIIHSNSGLTNVQKFRYLISSLEGDAARVIKSLEVNSDNYEKALSLLKKHYDDKRMITLEHVRTLHDLPTGQSHNTKETSE